MDWLTKPPRLWAGVLVSLGIVAAAVAVRVLFLGPLGARIPYVTFYPAVTVAALYGGLVSGTVATIALTLVAYFWIQNGTLDHGQWLAIVFFVASSALITAVCEAMRRTSIRLSREVAEHKRSEEALRESELRHRIVADNTDTREFWEDPHGRLIYCSPSCERLTGHTAEAFLADPGLQTRLVHPDDRDVFTEHRTARLSAGTSATPHDEEEIVFRLVRPDGSIRWVAHVCSTLLDEEGRFLGLRGSNRDVTDSREAEDEILRLNAELEDRVLARTAELEAAVKEIEKMHDLAYFDSLTGLGNRRYAEARITSYLAESRRHGWLLGVLYVDIDHFKDVNDRYGHDSGDAVLRMVGSTLRNAARASDFVGRWGGEEFVVLATHVAPGEFKAAADRLRVLVSTSEITPPQVSRSVTVSIGAAVARPGDSPASLVARADELMYEAKKAGRNCVVTES